MFSYLIKLFMVFNFLYIVTDEQRILKQDDFHEVGSYTINNKLIIYGYKDDNINNKTNAIFYIFDNDTNEMIKVSSYLDINSEKFVYLALLQENHFVLVCEEYKASDDLENERFVKTILFEYDGDGLMLTNTILFYKPEAYFNINSKLIIRGETGDIYYGNNLIKSDNLGLEQEYKGIFACQFQGEVNVETDLENIISIIEPGIYNLEIGQNQEAYDFEITVKPDVFFDGEKYSTGYLGNLKIYSLGELYLNQKEYLSGDIIDLPGKYHLQILGVNGYEENLDFVILPEIIKYDYNNSSNLLENEIIYHPIAIYTNGISALLNDEPYLTKIIDTPGNYNLTVYGVNGYSCNIPFSIYPKVNGVIDGYEYEFLEFNVFGKATLNNQEISGDVTVRDSGNYNLKLFMGDRVVEEYNFTITNPNQNQQIPIIDYNKYIKYILIGFIFIGVYVIFRKK